MAVQTAASHPALRHPETSSSATMPVAVISSGTVGRSGDAAKTAASTTRPVSAMPIPIASVGTNAIASTVVTATAATTFAGADPGNDVERVTRRTLAGSLVSTTDW